MFNQISKLLTSIDHNPDELIIANRYQLKYLIGRGAMGEVYCASDLNFDDVDVAIKFLSATSLNEKARMRFEKEAKLNALLGEQSINIVKVKDYGLDKNNTPFYVMELLTGSSLDEIINQKELSLREFFSLIRQICLGLEYAHNGIMIDGELSIIIHKDIKPSNIFLVQDSDLGYLVKILDFGIAQIASPSTSQTRSFMGTPQYCSPEHMAKKTLDPRADIYSLGVLMYEMLTSESPIEANENDFPGWYEAHHNFVPKSLPTDLNIPSDLEKLIIRCLEKSPDNRPQTVSKILKIINSLAHKHSDKNSTVHISNSKEDKHFLPLQERYQHISWPAGKPQQKILFPALTEGKEGVFASLWTMLEAEKATQFDPSSTLFYNHFLFQDFPHPMLLWINLLYNRNHGPTWLPCYLDLTTELGEQIVASLIEHKLYYILLFALNKPEKCQQIIPIQIYQHKNEKIQTCWDKSISWQGKKQPEASKKILKQQFEQVKVKIIELINKKS